jgi:DNA-binding NarL/FixJ family response regulator
MGVGGRGVTRPTTFLDRIAPGSNPLTPRQRDVLTLIALGHTSAHIAERLNVAEETVRTHARNIAAALGARTRAHAVALAMRDELIDPWPD